MPLHALCVALLALALSAAGCGDDEGESTPATTTTSGGATGAASTDDPAADADAKSNARAAQTALEVYATDNNGSYEGANPNDLSQIDPVTNEVGVETTADTYSITGTSESGNTFTIERGKDGSVTRTCTEAGVGGCSESGDW